jgi:hypothetical protein
MAAYAARYIEAAEESEREILKGIAAGVAP